MQYVNGHDIATQSITEVQTLALSNRIPWTRLQAESFDPDSSIWGYHSHEKGIYLNRGICDFNISPENMFELLYNLKSRTQWDIHCKEADIMEEYDHLNHIIRMMMTHPLGTIKMNLYRSCRYDPQKRLYVIAMRSIELDDHDPMENWFECLPNGWIIQGVDGSRDRCRLIFVQQCHMRDIELQSIPGYKSFETSEQLGDFHYLTIFPASVGGRLGKIFECLKDFILLNVKQIEIKDTRLKILEQAERQVNEMFGTSTIDYGFTNGGHPGTIPAAENTPFATAAETAVPVNPVQASSPSHCLEYRKGRPRTTPPTTTTR
ncbi:F-Box A protein [Cavenderia fasciculata]|uniref:F-Box A protein n=1 Tax=Cavenderia fasciculata TaxID=261658 RepID=F4PXR0_CACFS|nr:F-Box A protein [Cavenderia fasciculata]EGG19570.1 F-Box A protein [Cavenderia fasciculata]|eukprot:XP_004357864.1 F-Box A protein [Cavenderia fasciculata]